MKKALPFTTMIAYIALYAIITRSLPIGAHLLATLFVAVPLSMLSLFAKEVGGWHILLDIILCRTDCQSCNGTGMVAKNGNFQKCDICNGTGIKRYKDTM